MGVCACMFLDICVPHEKCVFGCLCVCGGGYMYGCKYVCVHARSSSWRKDTVTTADRCWCENGEVWAGKGGKRGRKGGETLE